MKVCSICLACYDDSIETCPVEDHSSLDLVREGNRLMIPGYRIESKIESGSPVELYSATHLASKEGVLIRFIALGGSFRALTEEIEAASGIYHPNLGRIFDFGETGQNETYLILEDISGISLSEQLEKTPSLSEKQAINIARQIAEGLETLHAAGLIHRAVSPANIYITNPEDIDFSVKLQNFDAGGVIEKAVARGANGVGANKEVLRYFSPEQFDTEKVDFKSDIYSLSVVLYEMLLGASPYDSLNPRAISEYAFNESDLKGLHIDLRALLAYTLREAFQPRLDLRPKSTSSYVRQLRHLELIAIRAEARIGNTSPKPTKEFITPVFKEIVTTKPFTEAIARETRISISKPIISDVPKETAVFTPETKPKNESRVIKKNPQIEISMDIAPDVEANDFEDTALAVIPPREESLAFGDDTSQAYAAPKILPGNKAILYIAGVLVAAVFGGILTAGLLGWQSNIASADTKQPVNTGASEIENSANDDTPEMAEISDEEFDARRDQESSGGDGVKNESETISISSGNVRKTAARRAENVSSVKKAQAKRRAKRNRKPRRKSNQGKVEKSDAKTRPRIVSNIVITY